LRLKTGSEGSRAHRAADDAYVTAALLRELLRRYAGRSAPQSISGLIEMITSPIR
jgi:DNA polymerase III epsilon subunit-like protein